MLPCLGDHLVGWQEGEAAGSSGGAGAGGAESAYRDYDAHGKLPPNWHVCTHIISALLVCFYNLVVVQ